MQSVELCFSERADATCTDWVICDIYLFGHHYGTILKIPHHAGYVVVGEVVDVYQNLRLLHGKSLIECRLAVEREVRDGIQRAFHGQATVVVKRWNGKSWLR